MPIQIGPTGKPMVQCCVCSFSFADSSSLYRHRKIHIDERPHKCPHCERRFIQRVIMMKHSIVH